MLLNLHRPTSSQHPFPGPSWGSFMPTRTVKELAALARYAASSLTALAGMASPGVTWKGMAWTRGERGPLSLRKSGRSDSG